METHLFEKNVCPIHDTFDEVNFVGHVGDFAEGVDQRSVRTAHLGRTFSYELVRNDIYLALISLGLVIYESLYFICR